MPNLQTPLTRSLFFICIWTRFFLFLSHRHNASTSFSGAQTFFPPKGSSEPPKLSNNHKVVVRITPRPHHHKDRSPLPRSVVFAVSQSHRRRVPASRQCVNSWLRGYGLCYFELKKNIVKGLEKKNW